VVTDFFMDGKLSNFWFYHVQLIQDILSAFLRRRRKEKKSNSTTIFFFWNFVFYM